MAHRNHRFQFVREALQELKQELDSTFQRIGDQKEAVKQSLLDIDTRLQHIEEHKSNFKKTLRQVLIFIVQKLKCRLAEIYTRVQTEFQRELDMIETRKLLLKDLVNKRQCLVERTEKATSDKDLLALLDVRTQVGPLLKEFSSPEATTPQFMTDMKFSTSAVALDTILNCGDLQITTVPFSLSQVPLHNLAALAESKKPSTPNAAVGPQSSTYSTPPSNKPLPQNGNDSQIGPHDNANHPSTPWQATSNQLCPPASSCQVNTQRTTSTSVYPAHIGQCPPYSAPHNSLYLKPNTVQSSQLPAKHSQSVLTSGNEQPQLPYQNQQSVVASSLSQALVIPVLIHQGPLFQPLNSCQTKPFLNINHLSTVSATRGDQTETSNSSFPNHKTLAWPQPPMQHQSLSGTPKGQQVVNRCSAKQRSHDKLAHVFLDQHKYKPSLRRCLMPKPNHQQLNTNQMQSSVFPVKEYQPILNKLGQLECLNQSHPNPSRTAIVLDQSSTGAKNNLSQSNEASAIYEQLIVPVNHNQSIIALGNQSLIINQLNQKDLESVSPQFSTSIRVMQKHPLLTKYLLKSQNGSSGKMTTLGNDEKSDTCPSPGDSGQPSASSPHHQLPTQTIKAAADSACDSSTPPISTLSAGSEHQAAENEPTSTVSEIQNSGEEFCPILSEFIQLLDSMKASNGSDSNSGMRALEGGAAEEPIPSLEHNKREAENIQPPSPGDAFLVVNQVSPVTVKAEEELPHCVGGSSVNDPQHFNHSAQNQLAKLEPNIQEEEQHPQTLDKTRSDWTVAALQQQGTNQSQKPMSHRETMSIEPSSPHGLQACSQSYWQPTVQLFKLSITIPPPGHPLPRFRLLPGDNKDEIYLQEIDKDHNQPRVDDVIDFLEPLSFLESPPVMQTVICAACRSPDSSIICVMCGRGFHRACHIPPIGLSIRSDWSCSLCQDLEDATDPYSSERGTTTCLSVLDQRKCEHLLLFLTCERSDSIRNQPEQVFGGSSPLSFICERLSHLRSPPYRTPSEFISDIWNFLHFLSVSTENSEELMKLQENFRIKLVETLGLQLHPSLLQQHRTTQLASAAGPPTDCHTQSDVGTDDTEGSKATTGINRSQKKTGEELAVGDSSTCRTWEAGLNESHAFTASEVRKCREEPGVGGEGSDRSTVLVNSKLSDRLAESKLRETRKRLRDFLGVSWLPAAKKKKAIKMKRKMDHMGK
ncbi:uncharacterized protein trim33l isoform X2 [Lampris incognitus]|nr:uncharacterized protein trim33l isoform X2 [Lampris incognitus]